MRSILLESGRPDDLDRHPFYGNAQQMILEKAAMARQSRLLAEPIIV